MKRIWMSVCAALCLGLAGQAAMAQDPADLKSALSSLQKARDADMGPDKANHVAAALAALKKAPADKCGHRVVAVKHTDLAKNHIQVSNAKSTKMAIDDAIKRVTLAIDCKK